MTFTIAKAAPGHVAALETIERAAVRLFEGKVPAGVLEDVTGEDEFRTAQAAGLLWVALVAAAPVGFALAEDPGEFLHLEEVDVHPAFGRRGIGAALVDAVCDEAALRGRGAVTLTSYRAFPWSMPFYARLGFAEIPPESLPPELGKILREEAARGHDPVRRVVMRRFVGAQKR